jgi:hypothetical protein
MAEKIKAQVWGVTTMGSFTLFTLEMHGITPFSYFFQKRGNNYHNAYLRVDNFGSSAKKELR